MIVHGDSEPNKHPAWPLYLLGADLLRSKRPSGRVKHRHKSSGHGQFPEGEEMMWPGILRLHLRKKKKLQRKKSPSISGTNIRTNHINTYLHNTYSYYNIYVCVHLSFIYTTSYTYVYRFIYINNCKCSTYRVYQYKCVYIYACTYTYTWVTTHSHVSIPRGNNHP